MRQIWTFRCPVCHKFVTWPHPFEPMCTGPSEMRHDHEPVIMHQWSVRADDGHVQQAFIPSIIAERNAEGPMVFHEPLTGA